MSTASTSLDYLQRYINDGKWRTWAPSREADLEAVMACEPDVIFIGGPAWPVPDSSADRPGGLPGHRHRNRREWRVKNARTIASLFGLEDQVNQLMEKFDSRIQAPGCGREEPHRRAAGW